MKKMPVIFVGHGSPMIALADNELTRNFKKIGDRIIEEFGKPKAILAISAHWYTRGTLTQSEEHPKQIYDMYGFPEELYNLKYDAIGDAKLSDRVKDLLGSKVEINDDWGIDHGTWSVLVHMFPNADIPIVQLSVNGNLDAKDSFEIGRELIALRDEGFLILGSGNIVHNLRLANWNSDKGTQSSDDFDSFIVENVKSQNYDAIINYKSHKDADYAVPTPDHFLPFVYVLGAAESDEAFIFNNVRDLDTISMTSFAFGM